MNIYIIIMIIKSKSAQVVGVVPVPIRILLLLIAIIIFFAFYPVISAVIDAVVATQTNSVVAFLIEMVPYIVIAGLFAWILKGEA